MLEGVYTALITPFKDGKVDYDGLKANVKYQLDNGVNGLLPLGTTGETPTLSEEEKDNIVKLVIEEAKGKVTIMVGTGSNSTEHTVNSTKKAKEMGADIALVVTPYYNKPTNEGIYRHFKSVSEIGIPIVVYNIAGRTGKNIDTQTLKRISTLPNIIGVKEASGDINQMGDVLNIIASDAFSVMSGDDGMTLPLLSLGGKGVISVVSNLLPKQIVSMVNSGLQGDFESARKKHFELMPIFKAAFIETNPIPIKEAMNMLGMAAGEFRMPMCEMLPENREKLKTVLQQMGLL